MLDVLYVIEINIYMNRMFCLNFKFPIKSYIRFTNSRNLFEK